MVDHGKEGLADYRNLCEDSSLKVNGIHIEKKALLAERYVRSLNNILYRYIEKKQKKCFPVFFSKFLLKQ